MNNACISLPNYLFLILNKIIVRDTDIEIVLSGLQGHSDFVVYASLIDP